MFLTLVVHPHTQIRRQKCAFKYSAVINILCDVIADIIDENHLHHEYAFVNM